MRIPSYPVETRPDQAFFWSGRTKLPDGTSVGGQSAAQALAAKSGGTTLEALVDKRNITIPDWDANRPETVAQWDELSRQYAQGASGKVRAVLGNNLRPGSTWERVELPTLKANPNVTQIITIDPATGNETVIFTR
jgi:hypothetical protein